MNTAPSVPPALTPANETVAIVRISPLRETFRLFVQNPTGMIGACLFGMILLLTLFGPTLYEIDPFDIAGAPFTSPDAEYWLGTDYLGRDILAGILVGGRATLTVGAVAAIITLAIGIAMGSLSGFFGGMLDTTLMKITEFFQVLPTLLFAMVLVTLFGASLQTITLAIGVVSWTGVARLTRAEFLRIRELDYVKAATAAGAGSFYTILRVILPNALPPIIVAAAFAIGISILFEGGMSFLGLGDPNVMSWGMMIGQNRNYALDAWWVVVMPGAAIFLAVLSISLIGDGINDALNPRLRKR
ncbi:ABC transporter permease [Ferrovibrio sp.]|uniref:ABC transporter permease n=1 Tax=Ferrovibrio sp. TaxID=1917215 RepID=UPI0035ADCA36